MMYIADYYNPRTSYLTFEAIDAGTQVRFARRVNKSQITKRNIEFSLDGGVTWTSFTASNAWSGTNSAVMVTLGAGQKVLIRGTNALYANTGSADYHLSFQFSNRTYVYGNIMSLCYGDDFAAATTLPNGTSGHVFKGLFRDATYMLAHPKKDLLLPALAVSTNSYRLLFSGCSNLSRVVCLATDISASYATTNMTDSVSDSGTFYKAAAMTSWPSGVNGIPDNWAVENYF